MTSHKRGNNNGAVREENELKVSDIAADHWLTEVTLISLFLFLSHNLVINCISLLSTTQASVTV